MKETLQDPHDRGYRLLFSVWKTVQQLISGYVDEDWKDRLDFANSKREDGTFILEDFEKKETDVLYRVPLLGENREIYVYILIEHQSTVDFTMAFRVLVYLTRVWLHFYKNSDSKERERKNFRFPPVFPVVVYNGKATWTATHTMKELVEQGELFSDFLPNVRYHLVDISAIPPEKLEELNNVLAGVFLLEKVSDPQKIEQAFQKCLKILEQEDDDELWKIIAQWVFGLLKREYPERKDLVEQVKFEGVTRKEIKAMLETLGQKLKAAGEYEGERRGMEKGLQKGNEQGVRKSILRVIKARFQNVPDKIEVDLESVALEEDLYVLLDKAALVTSLADFEKSLAERRSQG